MSFNVIPSMPNVGAITGADVLSYLGGKPTQNAVLAEMAGYVPKGISSRMAGTALGKAATTGAGWIARATPALSAVGNVMDVADIVAGDTSLANKAMDATAMTAGAAIGGFLGGGVFSPLTASIGASVGKQLSDGTQWLFGDKKTAEQRRMDEALVALSARGLA